jgi:hypothetical protein
MKSVYFILWCLFMTGCTVQNDFSGNPSNHNSRELTNQVETITTLGEFPVPDIVEGKVYTARIVENPKLTDHAQDTDCWGGDSLQLFLNDEAGNKVIDYAFCSSYGEFSIDFVDLNGDKQKEIVFVLGQGRGTSARREILTIYEVAAPGLHELYSRVYSDYYGSSGRWWYNRYYRDTDNDKIIDLELILSYDPIGETHLESPELIPKEKRIVYRGAKRKW